MLTLQLAQGMHRFVFTALPAIVFTNNAADIACLIVATMFLHDLLTFFTTQSKILHYETKNQPKGNSGADKRRYRLLSDFGLHVCEESRNRHW